MTISGIGTQTRDDLVLKLTLLLEKVDSTLLTRQQKLRLYQLAICPRLTWDMSVNSIPVSWLKNSLQTIATRFLKKWCGLARSADTGCIYLPKDNGGLELTSLVTLYKKLQVSKAATYMCSRDPVVRAIAGQETRKEASQQRPTFKPYQIVVAVLKEDPGASARKVINQAKSMVEEEETVYSSSLP